MKPAGPEELDRKRCQVGGINQNYTSSTGTLYHIQVEDLGPVVDRLTQTDVRRLNMIVYANYGEPNARIIYGRDYDLPDLRTREHNDAIQGRIIPDIVASAKQVIEEKEKKQVARIKGLIHDYHRSRDDKSKTALAEANGLFPFLFSRAWSELRREKDRPVASPPVPETHDEIVYPLEADLRVRVIEIERLMQAIAVDLESLKAAGKADDILIQTCRKMTLRAREALAGADGGAFTARRLDGMRSSLTTTWRQIQGRFG